MWTGVVLKKNHLQTSFKKIWGTGFDVPGDRKTFGEPKKRGMKATSWSQLQLRLSFFSTARGGRVDPLRRVDLRLDYSKTNVRRAKTR